MNKKLLMAIAFAILLLGINFVFAQTYDCTDSDGRDYLTRGYITGKDTNGYSYNNQADTCLNCPGKLCDEVYSSNYLGEFYCKDGLVDADIHECNCVEGVCTKDTPTEAGDKVLLEKGWNLVHFYPNPVDSITANSEIQIEDVLAVFIYVNTRHKMYEAYPDSNAEEDGYLTQVDFPYLFNSAYWIYSEKRGTLEVNREESKLSLSETKLSRGWNFLGITKEMIDKDLIDILGECQLEDEKMYIWQAQEQKWEGIGIHQYVDRNSLGKGIVVKVTNECNLKGGLTPPTIPN